MEVTAVIVARKGSRRIPRKSLSLVGSEPLLVRKIRQLKDCNRISRVVVGSDCDEMLEIALGLGVEAVRRPDYFCDESRCSANEMIRNMMELVKTDFVVWAHCTNPLISAETYDHAIRLYFEKCKEGFDSLVSVIPLQEHLWSDGKPLNFNPYGDRHPLASELDKIYMQDGGIFIQSHQDFFEKKYFYGQRPYLFEISSEEICDINSPRDLLIADLIIREKANLGCLPK